LATLLSNQQIRDADHKEATYSDQGHLCRIVRLGHAAVKNGRFEDHCNFGRAVTLAVRSLSLWVLLAGRLRARDSKLPHELCIAWVGTVKDRCKRGEKDDETGKTSVLILHDCPLGGDPADRGGILGMNAAMRLIWISAIAYSNRFPAELDGLLGLLDVSAANVQRDVAGLALNDQHGSTAPDRPSMPLKLFRYAPAFPLDRGRCLLSKVCPVTGPFSEIWIPPFPLPVQRLEPPRLLPLYWGKGGYASQ
jgi:hypothetical protein